MIFDVIYDFYISIFGSVGDVSSFWADWSVEIYSGASEGYLTFAGPDYFSAIATIVTIIFGIFALFKILGGVLRLVKPW